MERIVTLISNYLDIQTEDVKPDCELRALTDDSLDWIEIILALEVEFQIDIPDEHIDRLVTIQDIANYIEQYARK